MSQARDFDLIVVGSGFGGSLLALIAHRIGLRVLLIERGSHPRFAIGESTSPLANLVLEQLCRDYGLDALAPLSKYGRWKSVYPNLGCGLKRGFTFYHHEQGKPFHRRPDRSNELLVAASPADWVADTHWLRSDVDSFFVEQAAAAGVEYIDHTEVQSVELHGETVRLEAIAAGSLRTVRGAFVVDATGPRGVLFRHLSLKESPWPHLAGTSALYSHFADVPRLDPEQQGLWQDPGTGLAARAAPGPVDGGCPYPAECAAVHHVFDGGWIWSLRFDSGQASIGVAARPWLSRKLGLERGAPGWDALLDRFPSLEPLRAASPIRRFDAIPAMPFRSAAAACYPWAMLPGAAAFADPFLSTGIPLTLLGIERLSTLLGRAFRRGSLDSTVMLDGLKDYERATLTEADATSRYIAGCYSCFGRFELLSSYLMYYFAASSFAEVARRLGKASSGGLFLRADDAQFQRSISESRQWLSQWDDPRGAGDGSHEEGASPSKARIEWFRSHVRNGIEPINVAGLEDPAKRNWYPVDLQDLVRTSELYGMSRAEMAVFAAGLEREACTGV
ncbi:MAG: FAD-dependent oxidoreductase [Chloroflexi bacterium]|nr:FAD-dependent oxidoreductase [Chloroflexota bacterium]